MHSIFRSLGGPVFYYYLSQHASHVGCAQVSSWWSPVNVAAQGPAPPPGLSSWWSPAALAAQGPAPVNCWYLFMYLQTGKYIYIYRLGKLGFICIWVRYASQQHSHDATRHLIQHVCMNNAMHISHKIFFYTFMDVFSEMATQLFIRFRAETGTSADRGRVQCCEKFALEFFF